MTTQPQQPEAEERGGVPGIFVILATLSLFIIVPAFVYTIMTFFVLPAKEAHVEASVEWSERARWRTMPIQLTTMERGTMSSARTNKRYFELEFEVSIERERAVAAAAEVARELTTVVQRDGRPSEELRASLEAVIEAHPEAFYPRYVLGVWHAWVGKQEQADTYFQEAFDRAPAALVQRYVELGGKPVANYVSDPLTIAYDRVENDVLLQNLVMVYPPMPTDYVGAVYFPVFKMMYRIPAEDLPPGVVTGEVNAEWFAFSGPYGELPLKRVK